MTRRKPADLFPAEKAFFALSRMDQVRQMSAHKERVLSLTDQITQFIADNDSLTEGMTSLSEGFETLYDILEIYENALTEIANEHNYKEVPTKPGEALARWTRTDSLIDYARATLREEPTE